MKILIVTGVNANLVSILRSLPVGSEPALVDNVVNVPEGVHVSLFPEDRLHPKKLAIEIENVMAHCQSTGQDLCVLTYSENVLNFISFGIHQGRVGKSEIFKNTELAIKLLSDDNKEISHHVTLNEKGYFENWPFGFLDMPLHNLE